MQRLELGDPDSNQSHGLPRALQDSHVTRASDRFSKLR